MYFTAICLMVTRKYAFTICVNTPGARFTADFSGISRPLSFDEWSFATGACYTTHTWPRCSQDTLTVWSKKVVAMSLPGPLCSEFGCVRLYSTIAKVYYVIDTRRILGPAPMICIPVHPTIPHGTLPKSQAQRKRDHPEAKEDSRTGGDGSPQWIVNM